ncbi:hypothetical protein M231_00326 [Tremella mesenterica]|uniref:NAD(+) diphosphatase n=1 Tax=Tremella mesenterica TaxID=5217 RepID=A0A4Q1BWA1_TREME|nr:hypothetical protein M231_00326 [Tremella mesenterica]
MGDNIINFYAGQPPLNRVAFQRQSTDKLNAHLASPQTRILVFKNGSPLVRKGQPGALLYLDRDTLAPLIQDGYLGAPEQETDPKRAKAFEAYRPQGSPALLFLGIDDRGSNQDPQNPKGIPYFAINVEEGLQHDEGEFIEARVSGGEMDGWTAGVYSGARSVMDWNARYKFCPGCGKPNYSLWGGWKLNCTSFLSVVSGDPPCPSTKGLHNYAYPRTDPVIIMGILSSDGENILLGRQKSWPEGMYSCLAGFVEPGESFEDAVRRESLEEAGIEVGPVRYSSSQPWPFPSSLMVGCYGRAKDGQTIHAQWFPRSQVLSIVESASSVPTRADIKQLEEAKQTHHESLKALAPTDSKSPGSGPALVTGLTKVPAETAIAGQLIRLWAKGGMDLVSKL